MYITVLNKEVVSVIGRFLVDEELVYEITCMFILST